MPHAACRSVVRVHLFADAVGAGRSAGADAAASLAGLLGDRRVGEVAIAGDDLAVGACESASASFSAIGTLICGVLGAQTPHAVDAAALLHERDLGAGELDQVTALQPDVLRPEVARRVVRDRRRHIAV